MEEIWKDIVGYEGLYQVSNIGRVKSLNYRRSWKESILAVSKNTRGYFFVTLYEEGKGINTRVHRIVAQTFIPNPENKSQVNHIDGNKLNNTVENLEWNTASENIQHAFRIGLKDISILNANNPNKGKFGKNSRFSKKINQYTLDGEFIKTWDSSIDVVMELGINKGTLSCCCNGKQKTAGGFIWKFC